MFLKISKSTLVDSILSGLLFLIVPFLVTFFKGLNAEDFFVNLDPAVYVPAFIAAVNFTWAQIYVVAIPFFYSLLHPKKD